MSLLGKLLLVCNLLAAGAFTYFTLENRKVRKELTRAAVVRDIVLNGMPVEAGSLPADVDPADYLPFKREINNVPQYSIPKAYLNVAIPKGDEIYGGEPKCSQSDEVTRVLGKGIAHIPPVPARPHPTTLFHT